MDQPSAPFPEPLDSTVVPRFAGMATFMRFPAADDAAGLDIALAGVPFDLGITNRTGARHGPREIRSMSSLIRRAHPVSGITPCEICRVADVGDVAVNPVDLQDSLRRITDFFARIHRAGAAPVAAGGDHLITLPIFRAIATDRPVGMVQFDAHPDTLDHLYDEAFKYNHATPFRRAVEEGLLDPKRTVQIGLRGSRFSKDDLAYSLETGMRVITIEEYFDLGVKEVIAETRRVVGDGPVYISFDVDGLDPVYAPGTGVPEIGGFSTRDAQLMIRGLEGLDIVGGDVCEVSPPLDVANMTSVVAANLMFEILCVLADAVVRRKRG